MTADGFIVGHNAETYSYNRYGEKVEKLWFVQCDDITPWNEQFSLHDYSTPEAAAAAKGKP